MSRTRNCRKSLRAALTKPLSVLRINPSWLSSADGRNSIETAGHGGRHQNYLTSLIRRSTLHEEAEVKENGCTGMSYHKYSNQLNITRLASEVRWNGQLVPARE
jgi:hypothetical protein